MATARLQLSGQHTRSVFSFVGRLSTLQIAVLIFSISLLARIGFVFKTNYPLVESEIANIAINLSESNSFANPYVIPTGPTAHAAPAYPWILSLIYRAFPVGPHRDRAVGLLACVVSATSFALLPWLAVQLGMQPLIGVFAGLAGSITPLFLWIETQPLEAPWIAACLLLSLGCIAGLAQHALPRYWFICGVVIGISFLFGPVLLTTVACALLFIFHQSKRGFDRKWLILVATTAAIVAPWIIRNYVRLGSWFWLRDCFGLALYHSNNENARPWMEDNKISSGRIHPFGNRDEAQRFRDFGEVARNNYDFKMTTHWITENPRRFAYLTLRRFQLFWIPSFNHPAKTLAVIFLTAAGLLGLLLLFKQRSPAAGLLGTAWIVYPLTFYLLAGEARYRYPLHPIILLCASYLALFVFKRFRSAGSQDQQNRTADDFRSPASA